MKSDDDKNTYLVNSPAIDVMSPFYIHASDNPGHVYVGEVLQDGNYGDWVNEMSNVLFAKNKIGFEDGSIPIPEDGSRELSYWKRCNAMVRGWLSSAMSKEIRNSVKHAKTAQEIWQDLEERFRQESAPRAYNLRRALAQTKQEGMSISNYYTKMRGLWEEIQSISPTPKCTCGKCTCDLSKQLQTMRDKERLYEFLMGLNESFGVVKTQILSTKPMPSIGFAYHLAAEDEAQRQITAVRNPSIEAAAFQMQTQRSDGDGNFRKNTKKGE